MIIKGKKEIEGIRKACKLAAETLEFIVPFVLPDVTTEFINQKANEYIIKNKGESACLNYHGFPKETCISINEEVCHGIPSERKLVEGDIVNVDVLVKLGNYYGDTSRMYAVGKISEKAKKLITVTEECLYKGIEQVGPCRSFGNIGYNVNRHAVQNGFSVVTKFFGHGVGVKVHESLIIPHVAKKDSGTAMYSGMIFTIEPMINEKGSDVEIDEKDKWTARTVDGGLSAQYEHTILVTSSGYEILTKL